MSLNPLDSLPRLLSDFRRPSGIIKADYEDFVVEEQPLYPADGVGPHTYFLLEKRGLTTLQAIADVARALGVPRRQIGYAGMKDARAVSRQWMSVEHVAPEKLLALELPRLRVLEVTRHRNKLRLGHLRANRFEIKLRDTDVGRLAELRSALATLARLGIPNYFAQQRFGARGDAWLIGRHILAGDIPAAMDQLLGKPGPADYGDIRRARQLYEAGDYAAAANAWPAMFRDERRALKALARSKGKATRGFAAIDRSLRSFYVSAYQSYLFNQVVAARLPSGLGRLCDGDLAWIHGREAVFLVESAEAEQPRADALEISPTGPLFGYRMTEPQRSPGELERQLLEREGLTPDSFRAGKLRVKGARRPLRFAVSDADISLGADDRGAYLLLRFTLPRGCYATALLRELFDLTEPTSD